MLVRQNKHGIMGVVEVVVTGDQIKGAITLSTIADFSGLEHVNVTTDSSLLNTYLHRGVTYCTFN